MSHSHDDSLEPVGAHNDPESLLPQFHSTTYDKGSPTSFPDPSTPAQSSIQIPLNFHQLEPAHPQPNHLILATSDTSRPKQKMVAPKKKRSKKSSGESARGVRKSSTTPATELPAPRVVKLKLNLPLKVEDEGTADDDIPTVLPDVAPSPAPTQDEPSEAGDDPIAEDEPLPLAEPATTSRRSGRQIRKPQKDVDCLMGSEMDQVINQSSVSKADDDGDYGAEIASSPSYNGTNDIQILGLHSNPKPGRPRRVKNIHSSLPTINEELSSEIIEPQTPHVDLLGVDPISDVPDDISNILAALRSHTTVLIELPPLSHETNPDQEAPYNAKTLVQLYLVCYQSKSWHLCDLIADTWIRAFHSLRHQGQQKPQLQTWRPNRPLEKRQEEADMDAAALKKARKARHSKRKTRVRAVGFKEDAPDYKLDVADPELQNDVTSFNSSLLSELYEKTDEECGARLLWADAMALGGDKMEDSLTKTLQDGHSWHPELFVNIMLTSLRMVRRKLTLKIEEGCEGAWCKRYHEHSKHGLPCYRQLAWREKEERLASEHATRTMTRRTEEGDFQEGMPNRTEHDLVYANDEEMDAEMYQDELAAEIMEGLGGGEKRGYEDMGGGETSAPKRRQVHFDVDVGADVDAEGDSEED